MLSGFWKLILIEHLRHTELLEKEKRQILQRHM